MNALLQAFGEYPALVGVAMFLAISILLALLFSLTMRRAGMSLKRLIFFFGFLAIIALPQGAVHLLDAFVHARQVNRVPKPEPATTPAVSAPETLKPVKWDIVFGPNADPTLITDAKRGLEQIVHDAVDARISFNTNGETALAARFENAEAAAAALNRYGTFFQFAQVSGSDARRLDGAPVRRPGRMESCRRRR